MHLEQRVRAQALLGERGLDAALFANPASVTWLTGFAPPVQVGPNGGSNLFAGAPPLVWYADGRFTLIVVDGYAEAVAAFAAQPGCAVLAYRGYTLDQPLDGPGHLARELRRKWASPRGGKVGVELAETTALVYRLLADLVSAPGIIPIDGWLKPLRRIKTGEELDKLRHNFHLTDTGQAAARIAVQAGRREIDVWADVQAAIQREAEARVPLGNDLVAGHRQANMGGWPGEEVIRPGDSVIVDLSAVRYGYWSDGCATYYAGKPSAQQVEMHMVVAEALALGASLLRPGAVAGDIDRRLRQFIAAAGYPVYPHHSGHQVGLTAHESPRIVPNSDETLAAGMVIMLEPGIYLPGVTGVRLEDGFLITPDGAEVLTQHDKSLAVS
jgi:Xaa-Pro aminopeptidase